MAKKRLYLTEKPSQVDALKVIIKDNSKFAPLAGHLFRLLKPEEYDSSLKDWYQAVVQKKVPFFPKKFEKKLSETSKYKRKDGSMGTTNYKEMFEKVKKQIEYCDEIVIASDPDNEGASLAYEVIQACGAEDKVKGMMNMAATDPVSLSKSLKEFEANPDAIDYINMALASDTRAMFDWDFGMNLTMGATVALGGGDVIHAGGVKLPTTRMVVERDKAFEEFDEIPFWKLKGIAKDPKTGIEFPVDIKYNGEDKIDSEITAKKALSELSKNISVSDYKESTKKTIPPKPFSLLDMAAEVSRTSGLNMERSENAAQGLYDKGLQSYPRTEERFYSDGEHKQAPAVISGLEKNSLFQGLVPLKKPFKKRTSFDDKKLIGKAHGALSPTVKHVDITSLSPDEQKVYSAVAKRYYAQFMEDYEYLNINIKSKENNYDISASQNVEQKKGWKEISPSGKDLMKRTFPVLSKGDELVLVKTELEKGFTKPKPRFTELTLAQAMEKIANIYDDEEVKKHLKESGIGTPATRKKIIADLKNTKRGKKTIEPYLTIGTKGKDKGKIISSKKARDTINILPDNVTSPILRANLESMTKEIALGKGTVENAKIEIEKNIKKMFNSIIDVGSEKGIKMFNMVAAYSTPSEKQIAFAKKVAEHNNVPITDEILGDRTKLSEWIDSQKNTMRYTMSEKQMAILEQVQKPEIKTLIKQKDFSKEEFDLLGKAIKQQFEDNAKSWTYNLSEKQRAVLENEDNKVSKPVAKLIAEKNEFSKDEWTKIQAAIKKIFNTPKKSKTKNNDREI